MGTILRTLILRTLKKRPGRCAGLAVLLLSVTANAGAAVVSAVQTGNWSSAATWAGGTVPGNGDTINIPDNVTVTLTDDRKVGTSGGNGTVAVVLNKTGKLVVAAGGTLHLRGDMTVAGEYPSTTSVSLALQAGAVFEFDSSAASAPSSTQYAFRSPNNYSDVKVTMNGTSGSHVIVRSNPGGGSGYFYSGTGNSTYNFVATYTDFLRIGDSAQAGWQIALDTYSNTGLGAWNVTHSTFTSCGKIYNIAVGVGPVDTFIHDYNVHSGSASAQVFGTWANTIGATGGTREIKGNVFDVAVSRDPFYTYGFSISGNYMGDGFAAWSSGTSAEQWSAFNGNLVRFTSYWNAGGYILPQRGPTLMNTYLFLDADWNNPHVLGNVPNYSQSATGLIFGHGGSANTDSGELYWSNNPSAAYTFGVYNSIVLPNAAGYGSMEIGSLVGTYSANTNAIAEHNTWFGGFGVDASYGGFGAIQVSETGPSRTGELNSFRSNILWNPQLSSYPANFLKVADISGSSTPTTDVCAPANCDYNTGWGSGLSNPTNPALTNQGKGYAAKFTSTPGVHDVDVNPKFVDWQRNLELFDSKYLGNSPAGWVTTSSYSVGDFVQHARSNIYWNLPVNYRYVNGGACGGTNPEPGIGTNWRDCWEWATLYRIRQAVGSQVMTDDQVIGVHGEDMITTLLKWVRAGYAPTNTALLDAGHDGFDIGAVPVVFLPPSTTATGALLTPNPNTPVLPHGRPK